MTAFSESSFAHDDMQDYLDGLSAAERRALRADASAGSDLAAYLQLYDALEADPDAPGALPENFSEQVARRAFSEAGARRPAWQEDVWTEGLALAALLAGAVAGVFWLVPGGFATEPLRFSLDALMPLWNEARLDLVIAAGLVLLLIGLIDRYGRPGSSGARPMHAG